MGSANSETNYSSDESTGSCEGPPPNTDPTIYFKNLDLQFFVEEPLAMFGSFITLKNECLSTGNPKAHYIEGLLQYFQHRRSLRGLNHLRQSADGDYDYGIYIYGILMLCIGNSGEGKEYLDRLSWKTDKARTDRCLTMVKRSLKEIKVILKATYVINTDSMEPLTNCDKHDMDSGCEDCYYFKRMEEFVEYIRSKPP